jgi:hypothetical protein
MFQLGELVSLKSNPLQRGRVFKILPNGFNRVIYQTSSDELSKFIIKETALEGTGQIDLVETKNWLEEWNKKHLYENKQREPVLKSRKRSAKTVLVGQGKPKQQILEECTMISVASVLGDLFRQPWWPKVASKAPKADQWDWSVFRKEAKLALSPKEWVEVIYLASKSGEKLEKGDAWKWDAALAFKEAGDSPALAMWKLIEMGLQDSAEVADVVKKAYNSSSRSCLLVPIASDECIFDTDKVFLVGLPEHPEGVLVEVKKGQDSEFPMVVAYRNPGEKWRRAVVKTQSQLNQLLDKLKEDGAEVRFSKASRKQQGCVVVSSEGQEKLVPLNMLAIAREYPEGQDVVFYAHNKWVTAVVKSQVGNKVTVVRAARTLELNADDLRFSVSSGVDRAVQYGMHLLKHFDLGDTLEEIQRRFKLAEEEFVELQKILSHQRVAFVYSSKVQVQDRNRVLRGRFVKRMASDKSLVQFADGFGVIKNDKVSLVAPTLGSQFDYVVEAASSEAADTLLSALKGRFSAQKISSTEISVEVPDDRESEFIELAYEHVPLDKLAKQDVKISLIEACEAYELSELGDNKEVFSNVEVGSRADGDVINYFSGEVLIPKDFRYAEEDLEALRKFGSNRLMRSSEGKLLPLGVETFDFHTDPFLNREVQLAFRDKTSVPDEVMMLEDGCSFVQAGTTITEGLRKALQVAGPLAFVESFARKYVGAAFQPELKMSYELTNVREAKESQEPELDVKLAFVRGGRRFNFILSSKEIPLVKGGWFDQVGFQVALLTAMVKAGIEEDVSYRFVRTPQYAMLLDDVKNRISPQNSVPLLTADFNNFGSSVWVAHRILPRFHEIEAAGVDVSTRDKMKQWAAEYRPGDLGLKAFLGTIQDHEYDKIFKAGTGR